MKKGGLFSRTLYREGLRQTQALGWVLIGLLIGTLLLVFMMQFGAVLTNSALTRAASFVDLYDGVPLLPLIYLWAPIMIIVLFHFVTKRNQSDFYHALAHTRPQLAGSFLAAILTWTLGGLLVAFGLYAALYTILPDSIAVIHWAGSLNPLASATAILTLVVGGTFLAVSLTGTASSAILGTGLILFMPRILIGIVTERAVAYLPIVSAGDLPFPLGSYNLLADFFSTSQSGTMHAPLSAILYTFLLGVLYLGLGLWAFTRRKSEKAGMAAISKSAQGLLRALMAAPMAVGAVYLLVNTFIMDKSESGILEYAVAFGTASSAFTLLCISFGVFLLYELFTTRTAKRLGKIIPSFGFVLLVGVSGGVVIVCTRPALVQSVPEADDIESVAVIPGNNDYDFLFGNLFGYEPSYFEEATRDVYTNDPDAIKAVATALQSTVKSSIDSSFDYLSLSSNNDFLNARFAIRLKNGGEQIRTVQIASDQLALVEQSRWTQADYVDTITNLPDETRTPVIVRSEDDTITEQQARIVYASLRQELTSEHASWWCNMINGTYEGADHGSVCSLYMQTVIGSDVYSASLPLSDLFPKTLEMYLNFARENADFEKWLAKNPLTLSDTLNSSYELSLSAVNDGSQLYIDNSALVDDDGNIPAETAKAWNATIEWIRQQAQKPIDIHGDYGRVNIWLWQTNGRFGSVSLYIPLDDIPDEVKQLYEIGKRAQAEEEGGYEYYDSKKDEWVVIYPEEDETSEEDNSIFALRTGAASADNADVSEAASETSVAA